MATRSLPEKKRRGTPRLPICKENFHHPTHSGPAKTAEAAQRAAPPPATEAPLAPATSPPVTLDWRNEKTITVKEAAYLSMKSDDTIYKWLRNGRLRGWQPGGPNCHVLVSAKSLEELLRYAVRFGK